MRASVLLYGSLSSAADVAIILQTVAIALGVVYGLGQVREARRAREASVILDLFQRLHALDASDRRHMIYTEIAAAWPTITPAQEAVVRQTINEFDLLAYLTLKNVVPIKAVTDLYYGTTLRVWEATSGYIEQQRDIRGTRYGQYFEQLVQLCRVYMAERRPLEHVAPTAAQSSMRSYRPSDT